MRVLIACEYSGTVRDAFAKRVLVGSTTQLTIKGFAIYLQKMEADGANIGVQFSANPNEQRMMR